MKSNSIASDRHRERVVQEITAARFSIYLLVGNKQLLTSPGLRYPKSFIKYLHGRIYSEVVKDCAGVAFRADCIKNPAFMREMKSYLDHHLELGGLFKPTHFEFVDSKLDLCIQVADFIGGSVRQCFERNSQTAMLDPLMTMLSRHIVNILPFPESYGRYIAKMPGRGEYDQDIESRAVLEAEHFLAGHRFDESEQIQMQLEIVRRLLQSLMSYGNDQWVTTEELMRHVDAISSEPCNEQAFRNLIGKLRDAGVLISSRTSWGYKIPTSMDDMIEYINRQNSQLTPMIERVRIARETVRRATNNAVDILSAKEFSNLKLIVDATPHWSQVALKSTSAA